MAALHTEQLEYLLVHLVQRLGYVDILGVFPADLLPTVALLRVRSRDVCFIANTDPHNRPGSHWLAFYYRARFRTLEYFDPYGFPLNTYKKVYSSFKSNLITVTSVNSHILQALDSTACGYYCVLFLRLRATYHMNAEGYKEAVLAVKRLSSIANSRDKKVVDRVHRLMHSNSCKLPTDVSFTRQSQCCIAYNK